MAARVTKQFLQNALDASASASASAKTKGAKQPSQQKKQQKAKKSATSKKVRAATSSSSSNSKKPKKSERFLEAAKKELESADRTRENVQKLQVRTTDKSQRLMAKVRLSW